MNEAKFSDVVAQLTAIGLIGWGSFLLIRLPVFSRKLADHTAELKMSHSQSGSLEARTSVPFDFNGTMDQITAFSIGGILLQALFYIILGVVTLVFCAVQRKRKKTRQTP